MKELNEDIINFRINPDQLDKDQQTALDDYLRTGAIDGIGSLQSYEQKIQQGRRDLRDDIETAAEPTADFIGSRASFELGGELFGSFTPYIMDQDKLKNYFTNNNYRTKLGENFKNKFFKTLDGTANLIEKITLPKRGKVGLASRVVEPLFKRTSALLKNVSRNKFKADQPIISQPEATFLKSITGGAAGAGAGSIAFDVGNLQNEYAAAVQADLAGISDNEIYEKSPGERILSNAMAAAGTSAIFTGAIASLTPLGRLAKGKVKSMLGVDTKEAKALAEHALSKGVNLNLPSLADENTFFGKLLKGFFKTVGVLPVMGVLGKDFQRRLTNEVGQAGYDILETYAPVHHVDVLGHASKPLLRKNFAENASITSHAYKEVQAYGDLLDEKLGNVPFIQMKKLGEVAKKSNNDYFLLGQLPKLMQEDPVLQKALSPSEFQYFLGQFQKLGLTDASGKIQDDISLTAKEWFAVKKTFNNLYKVLPPYEEVSVMFKEVLQALDSDLNALSNQSVRNELLQSGAISSIFQKKLQEEGQEGATRFMNEIALGTKTFGDFVTRANNIFVDGIQTTGTRTANELRRIDDFLFTNKGLISSISGKQAISPELAYSSVFKRILQEGTPSEVTYLQKLVGAIPDKSFPARQYGIDFYKRLVSRQFYDNFLSSFSLKNIPKETQSAVDFYNQAKAKGLLGGKYLDEVLDASSSKDYSLRLQNLAPNALTEGVGQRNIKIEFDNLDSFDVNKFNKNFGLTGTAEELAENQKRLEQVYRGMGFDGKQAVKDLTQFSDLVNKAFEFEVGDTSKFLARRIAIGGTVGAGIIGTTGATGYQMTQDGGVFSNLLGTGIGLVLPVFLYRYGAKTIADPRTMRGLLDVYTPGQRAKQIGKGDIGSGRLDRRSLLQPFGGQHLNPSKRRTLGAIINSVVTSDPGAPLVDLEKLDFNEVTDYMLNNAPKSIDTNIEVEKLFKEKDLKQRHPDLYVKNSLSPEEMAVRKEYEKGQLNAALANEIEEDEEANASLPIPMSTQEQSAVSEINTNIPTIAPSAPARSAVPQDLSFEALFPNDPTGQLIAQRGQRNART